MEIINIITRCSRLTNLVQISETIFNTDRFSIKWFIIFDRNSVSQIDVSTLLTLQSLGADISFDYSLPGDHGHEMVNKTIDKINEGWIYMLDDDNILHENFYEKIYSYMSSNPNSKAFIFSQKIGGIDFTGQDVRYSHPDNVKVGKIDMAQFILKRDFVGERRIPVGYYVGDGMFIEKIYQEDSKDIFFIDEILSYYNYFQQIKKPNRKFLPRVLVVGEDRKIDLKSNFVADYESTEIFTLHTKDDQEIDKHITEFDPDCIISVGDNYSEYENLCTKSYDIRKRWIHHKEINEENGAEGYYCASDYILNPHYSSNPLVSLFTPMYNTDQKLLRAYESIKNQTYANWEWVLVDDSSDGGKTLKIAEELSKKDARVKVYDFHKKTGGIVGESKYRAACLCNGIYLMEFDHDDYLLPDAIALMVQAFEKHPDCKFVYSDFAEIDENHNSLTYGESFSFDYGSYRDESWNGRVYKTANTSNINPKTIRHIVGVPNHFRAWERFFYHSIGGHNRRLSIADDYELIVRTFLKTKMVRIPKLLYLQFYHNSNTQNATRKDIQRRVRTISNFYNERIKQRFEELGCVDWAYQYNPSQPLTAPSLFGNDEQSVNYIMRLKNDSFEYDWSVISHN
jgi:glycosyltransferase involved in cell wall biosynthesis